ncbi:heparinase II/III domain-containing protein [Vallitalea maricola]|uniref:Uncharacterized protein n=1 Tax=Vallitalea maricola TaxID=3074433 RepID=A0ACB5UDV0_9FIRM|nr:hypothetical protein AN2V17_00110 [Vallitalea sp. AN17-2]
MYNKREILLALKDNINLLTTNNILEKINDNLFTSKQIELLKEHAKKYSSDTESQISYRKHRLFSNTGDRAVYEKDYFSKRGDLMTFSLLSFLYPDNNVYITNLENILWSICCEYSWCLPAHFLDAEDNIIDFNMRSCHIDLFACETGLALCETLQINRNNLSNELIATMENEVNRRILEPFSNPNNFYRFEKMSNNWSSVCGGSIGSIAMYLIKDKYKLTNILHRALSCIDVYLKSFGDDGVCTEGVSYWTYGFGFFVVFADLLFQKTQGKLNLFDNSKVKNIALSQQLCYIYDNHVISFADGIPTDTYRLGLASFLQKKYKEVKLPDIQYATNLYDDHCYRFCLSLRDFLWSSEDTVFGLEENISEYLEDSQWFISKNTSTSIVAKGGNNDESHNHNDVGSFIYYKNDKPILCDLGAGLYDKNYFSDKRYNNFCTSSKSHNIPIINGHLQEFGKQYKAKNIETLLTDNVDSFSLELQDCYDDNTLKLYSRSIEVKKNTAPKITITDTFEFKKEGIVTENFISLCPIEVLDNRVVFTNGNIISHMEFDSVNMNAKVSDHSFVNHFEEVVPVFLLQLTPKEKSKNVTIILTLS